MQRHFASWSQLLAFQSCHFLTLLYELCSDYQIEAPTSAESVILSVSKATVSPPPSIDLKFQLFFAKLEDSKLREFGEVGALKTPRICGFQRKIQKSPFSRPKVIIWSLQKLIFGHISAYIRRNALYAYFLIFAHYL